MDFYQNEETVERQRKIIQNRLSEGQNVSKDNFHLILLTLRCPFTMFACVAILNFQSTMSIPGHYPGH